MGDQLKKGCLIRWVVDYEYYAAPHYSAGVVPQEPIYKYGVVMEIAHPDSVPYSLVVFCFDDNAWEILDVAHDQFEVLNG